MYILKAHTHTYAHMHTLENNKKYIYIFKKDLDQVLQKKHIQLTDKNMRKAQLDYHVNINLNYNLILLYSN